ncbi:MAG TPA: hypothetical protein VGJ74_07745 [Burkholderiales bacterium]
MKRRIAIGVILACAVVAAQSQPQLPNMPQTPEEKQFYAVVSRAIYQLMPQDKERFLLLLGERAHPVFPGDGTNSVEHVQCERLAAFEFLGYANQLGNIGAAMCKNGARVRELSVKSRARLAATLKRLPVNEEQARRVGWYYAQETLGDGSEFYYFPVIGISHGVLSIYTGALYDKKTGSASVVQMAPYPMCEREQYKDAPFCTDMRGALKRLLQALRTSS